MTALDYIRRTASRNHATLVTNRGEGANFEVCPPLPSGAPGLSYVVRICAVGPVVTAKEFEPDKLPDFCPERHISSGGAFCLNWEAGDPLQVVDDVSAAAWWRRLLRFLLNQRIAERRRCWPGKAESRAHGQAALFQAQAETAADRLGQSFRDALKEGRLSTYRLQRSSEHRVRLHQDGKRIASVIEENRQVMTLRSRCRCVEGMRIGRPLRKCSDHAVALADLTLSMEALKRAEKAFWGQVAKQGKLCCGTIDDCPLSNIAKIGLRQAA